MRHEAEKEAERIRFEKEAEEKRLHLEAEYERLLEEYIGHRRMADGISPLLSKTSEDYDTQL